MKLLLKLILFLFKIQEVHFENVNELQHVVVQGFKSCQFTEKIL